MKFKILQVLAAGLWITLSEFARNQILFSGYWVEHYQKLGLNFQTLPLNGFYWMLWSFLLAYLIQTLLSKFSFIQVLVFTWIGAFLMMWIVIYNLQVLPMQLLLWAVPLSIIELTVAELIISKIKS